MGSQSSSHYACNDSGYHFLPFVTYSDRRPNNVNSFAQRKMGYQYIQDTILPQQPGNTLGNLDQRHISMPCQPQTQFGSKFDGIRRCASCNVDSTPLWRRGQNGETLCNACGTLFLCRIVLETKTIEISVTGG
jgi:hypothetical protein